MDTYEKKYKDALEKARQLCAYPTTKPFINDLQDLFPELKELEDERIRKELIDIVTKSPITFAFEDKGKVLAWLEKQGKKKPIEEVNGEDYGIDSLWHAKNILEKTLGEVEGYQSDDGILEHKCAIAAVNKLYKQKPTWSQEDREYMESLLDIINGTPSLTPSEVECHKDWLNSLKQRIGGEQ